jgi:ankyrin repeat protein
VCAWWDKCLRLLVENNADMDVKNDGGSTGLTIAAYRGHLGCVKVMVEAKAYVDNKNRAGNTALTAALMEKECDCLKVLLDHGGGISVSVDTKTHALGAALNAQEFSAPVAYMLLAHGTDIDAAAEQVSETMCS